MKNIIYFFLLLISLNASGQQETNTQKADTSASTNNTESVPMADKFREDGKIYVVVAVVLIIFLGMLFYIFTLEKKISRIEKEINSKK
jgi:CcmD family protein